MPADHASIAIDGVGDFESVLLQIFLEEARVNVASIESAVAEQAYDRVRDHSHQLKGACLCIGAQHVSELASVLERHGVEERRDGIEENWYALGEEFGRLESYIKTRLDRA